VARGVSRIGLTAGASAPEVLVEQVSERLANFGLRTNAIWT